MKKGVALLSILGVAVPYYYIFQFIQSNNGEWSTALFFEQINLNYGMSILNADLTIAASTFLIFIIYRLKIKAISNKQFIKYLASLFLVGFSLALPWYLYDHYNKA
ncbi:MAG: DUF2834 domain-containing protein [Flavobacteriaceae bacterium]